jgi:hypothetical protein
MIRRLLIYAAIVAAYVVGALTHDPPAPDAQLAVAEQRLAALKVEHELLRAEAATLADNSLSRIGSCRAVQDLNARLVLAGAEGITRTHALGLRRTAGP